MAQIRIALVEPDPTHRAALEEQFGASGEFTASTAPDLAALCEEADALALVDLLLLGDRAVSLEDAMAKGFRGPVITLGFSREGALGLERPFRYSALAGQIRNAIHDHARSAEARFQLGPYEFSPVDRTLSSGAGEPIRLTDKEAAILRYLHRAGERPVSREELLGEVWGYQSGVTTHTLETHIYRLRQKIEPDPSAATLLVTAEGGYRLGQG